MIRYRPEAEADLVRLYAWQSARDGRLAEKFQQLLVATEKRIAARPQMFPLLAGGEMRKCLMRFGRSAYVIYFIIEGDDQVVLRVWHGREARR